MITRTVGVGGDFADIGLAHQWLAGFGDLADDYTFIVISDNTLSVDMGGLFPQLNDKTVIYKGIVPPTSHLDAIKITINGAKNCTLISNLTYGNYEVENLYFDGLNCTQSSVVAFGAMAVSVADQYHQYFKNCFVRRDGSFGTRGVWIGSVYGSKIHIVNCKVWDCGSWAFGHTAGGGNPLRVGEKIMENVTIYNCGTNAFRDYGITMSVSRYWNLKNVISHGAADLCIRLKDPHTMVSCATEDASADGTNPQHNIVAADEFKSLDDTNADFLKLNDGEFNVGGISVPERGEAPLKVQFTDQTEYSWPDGVLTDGGTAPTLTDEDIEGLSIPNAEGFYSIGCHQAQIV